MRRFEQGTGWLGSWFSRAWMLLIAGSLLTSTPSPAALKECHDALPTLSSTAQPASAQSPRPETPALRLSDFITRKVSDSLGSGKYLFDDPEVTDAPYDPRELEGLLTYWYHPKRTGAWFPWFQSRGLQRFESLLLEPGIANRMAELQAYIEAHPESSTWPPSKLRFEFNRSLGGTVRLYRAIYLRPEQAELTYLQRHGLAAPALYSGGVYQVERTLRPPARPGIPDHPLRPIDHRDNRLSTLWAPEERQWLSYSAYRDVAESVGYWNGQPNDPLAKFTVIEMEVPVVATIRMVNLFHTPFKVGKEDSILVVGDQRYNEETNRDVELFVPYSTAGAWIRHSGPPSQNPPPRWERPLGSPH